METIKVVQYVRVSTTAQDLDRQYNEIRRLCDYENYEIVETFYEKESGKIKERPELMRMMGYFKTNPEIKFVVISELSRLGRTSFVLTTIEEFSRQKIGLISIKEKIKTLNEDGTVNATTTMITSVLASINSYELDTMRYRMLSGKVTAVKNGGIVGNDILPYGYKKVDKKLVVDETESLIIQQIFEMSLTNTCTFIANYLNNKEVPTRRKRKWRESVLRNILKNSIYAGQRNYKGIKYDCPQIVDIDLFDKVQIYLKSNMNRLEINQKYDYLLNKKIMICGVCGKPYAPNSRPTEKTYKCRSTTYKGEGCGNNGVNVNKIENAVINLVQFDYGFNLINELMKPLDVTDTQIELNNELLEIEMFLKKQNSKKSNLVDLMVDGIISKEDLKVKSEPIEKEILKLKNQIVNIKAKLKIIDKQLKNIEDIEFSDNEEQTINKDILRNFIQSITIYPTDKHLTQKMNDITIRAELLIQNQITSIFISNRTNEIEIIYPSGIVKRKLNQNNITFVH